MKLRVCDFQHTADGILIKDDQGRPKKNGGTYLVKAKGDPHPRNYFPGDTFELDDEVARAELRINGRMEGANGARAAIIERYTDYLSRQEREAAQRSAPDHDRNEYQRKTEELAAQVEQNRKRLALMDEHERNRSAQKDPPSVPVVPEVLAKLAEMEARLSARDAKDAQAAAKLAETEGQMRALEQQVASERAARERAEQELAARAVDHEQRPEPMPLPGHGRKRM